MYRVLSKEPWESTWRPLRTPVFQNQTRCGHARRLDSVLRPRALSPAQRRTRALWAEGPEQAHTLRSCGTCEIGTDSTTFEISTESLSRICIYVYVRVWERFLILWNKKKQVCSSAQSAIQSLRFIEFKEETNQVCSSREGVCAVEESPYLHCARSVALAVELCRVVRQSRRARTWLARAVRWFFSDWWATRPRRPHAFE